ncbi:MAG: SlyX family protein [Pseudomonadales bacterium]
MPADLAGRIYDLEARLAFQDDTIAALNDALVAQQARITELERSLAVLVDQLHELAGAPGDAAEEPPPPHY